MISGIWDWMMAFRLLGIASVTRPAPDLKAPSPLMAAAPAFPVDPPTTSTCPAVPLWLVGALWGNARAMASGVRM